MATFITPVSVTPSTKGSWVDVDCSSYIASGATGVILHIYNTSDTYGSICDIRKNGSTDELSTYISITSHSWICIGVDANRKFEAQVGDYANITLVGYFGDEAVFFTNATNKGIASTGAWTDISIATETGTDTAIAAIFIIPDYASWGTYGLRKNGSSDARNSYNNYSVSGFIVGVDGSEICEGYISDTDTDFYLVGYIKSGATMNTNATDYSLGSTGSYSDLTTLPAGATGAMIEVVASAEGYSYAIRKNGSSEDIYQTTNDGTRAFAIVEADTSRIIEGKISNTGVDFYLIGYFGTGVLEINKYETTTVSEYINIPEPGLETKTQTVTAKALLNQTKTQSVTAKGDITGEGITPVTRTKTMTAKGFIPFNEYGMLVSKPTYSALSDGDPSHFIFDSAYGTLKYYDSGTVTVTQIAGDGSCSTSVAHNLGYIPYVEVYALIPYGWYEYCPANAPDEITGYNVTYTVDSTNINFYASIFDTSEEYSVTYKYFIFRNDLDFNEKINVSDSTTVTDSVTI